MKNCLSISNVKSMADEDRLYTVSVISALSGQDEGDTGALDCKTKQPECLYSALGRRNVYLVPLSTSQPP